MVAFGTHVLLDGRFQPGHLVLEPGRRALEVGEPGDRPGLVCPPFVNAHTHLGDAALADREIEGTVEEIFAPPDGLKHRYLAEQTDADAVAGMVSALATMARTGTIRFWDFREDGTAGIRLLEQALAQVDVDGRILGRPADLAFSADEVDELLDRCAGLGLSALRDFPEGEAEAIAKHVHARDGVLALHASEADHEPIEPILDLGPDLLVHLCQATDDELEQIVDAGIPVACCPRSNDRFDLTPPIPKLLDLGGELHLGTDNAMLQTPDLLDEVLHALRIFPDVDPARLLWRATRDPLDEVPAWGEGPVETAVIVAFPGDDPAAALRAGDASVEQVV